MVATNWGEAPCASKWRFHEEEKNSTEALIRGVASGLNKRGYNAGGFKCYAESDVINGGGMSSSAAFEVLLGTIQNDLYNEGKVSTENVAKIGQFAENVYFMKASGLLDQMACSVGSFAAMDFKDPENPVVEKVPFDPADYGYDLIITDVKASHADLSDEYSKVPLEMKAAAKVMGHEVLSEATLDELFDHVKEIREQCGDRAFLRAYHFLNETQRAHDEAEALKKAQEEEKKAKEELQKLKDAMTLKTGDTITVKGVTYRVTNAEAKTAEAYGVVNKNQKHIEVAATVKIKGSTCKVTAIADQAFAGMKKATKAVIGKNVSKIGKKAFNGDGKLKSITVKSRKLKTVGKLALKGINKKAVIRIPKSKKKAYRKLFKGKGQKKSVIVK